MQTVTPEQAHETYNRTVRDEDRHSWATWVIAVSNSLAAGEWIGYEGCPAFAKEVFELALSDKKISFSDSK